MEKTFLRGGPGWVKAAGAYGWVSVGRVFWVSVGSPGTSLLVATMGDGSAPVSLNGNVELVSAFLSKQFQGRFPGENAYGAIAQFVKDALLGKMPLVADRERLADLRRTGLAAWLKGREKDPAKFEQWFTGIVGHEGKTEWRLQFNVVDTRGGVDLVRVAGTVSPLSVRHFSVQAVKPAGEFFFAVEG